MQNFKSEKMQNLILLTRLRKANVHLSKVVTDFLCTKIIVKLNILHIIIQSHKIKRIN